MKYIDHAGKLLQLAAKDLEVRERLMNECSLGAGYHPEMEMVHRKNTETLRNIIEEIGFPGISKVGEEANEAAWLIVQHSIAEPQMMMDFYKMMSENGWDVNKKHMAYLYDRIQYFQGKPQKYGTQLNSDGSIYPVSDREQLNVLRMQFDLLPVSEADLKMIRPAEHIGYIEKQDPDYVIWRNSIGWKRDET